MILQTNFKPIQNPIELFERIKQKPLDSAIQKYLSITHSDVIEDNFYDHLEKLTFKKSQKRIKPFTDEIDLIRYLLKYVVSKDKINPLFTYVFYNATERHLVATNKHILSVIPCKDYGQNDLYFNFDDFGNIITTDIETKYARYLDLLPDIETLNMFFYLDIDLMQDVITISQMAKTLKIKYPRIGFNGIIFNAHYLATLVNVILKCEIDFINFGSKTSLSNCISISEKQYFLICPIQVNAGIRFFDILNTK